MTQIPQEEHAKADHTHADGPHDLDRLRRSLSDRKVAGLAGGLGHHLNIDPTIFRVVFVVLCLFGGAGFVLYAAGWLLVPEDGAEHGAITTTPPVLKALLIGAFVIAGLVVFGGAWNGPGFGFPLVLAGVGVIAYVMLRDRSSRTGPVNRAGPSTPDPAGATPEWMPPTRTMPVEPRPDRGPLLFGVTLALVALALGGLGMYDVAGGSVPTSAYPALALAVIGAVLMLGAWIGRAGGLILLGTLTAIVLAVTSVANPGFQGDRRIDVAPTSAVNVKDAYFVPAGAVYLDLSQVNDVAALDGRHVSLGANAGELVVILPDRLSATVNANVSVAGQATVPGRSMDGTNVHLNEELTPPTAELAHIDLELRVVVGTIEVRQS